ncbi:hypothetical protein [Salarchaeum japonicum]|uniref:Uncharacterized protein n=1 Tax=Salarchaeum japonicum TaxID=555573 RepID=A0AAV3T3X3_9EURY|nr:hypothetical protein [Salarchaeum japonicum]
MERRDFVCALGSGGVLGLAGCSRLRSAPEEVRIRRIGVYNFRPDAQTVTVVVSADDAVACWKTVSVPGDAERVLEDVTVEPNRYTVLAHGPVGTDRVLDTPEILDRGTPPGDAPHDIALAVALRADGAFSVSVEFDGARE